MRGGGRAEAEGEQGAQCSGLLPRPPGSRPEPETDINLLSHPDTLIPESFYTSATNALFIQL